MKDGNQNTQAPSTLISLSMKKKEEIINLTALRQQLDGSITSKKIKEDALKRSKSTQTVQSTQRLSSKRMLYNLKVSVSIKCLLDFRVRNKQKFYDFISMFGGIQKLILIFFCCFLDSIYANKPAGAEVFAEMKKTQTPQDTNLNHEEIVNRLNKIQGKTWTAKVPINMAQMTLEKMNSRAGIRQKKKAMYGQNIEKSSSFIEVNEKATTDYAHFSKEDTTGLPKEFNWAEKIHPARSQEDCGSCYAIATTAMLSSRLWITTGDNTVLSPQHSLACNFYNQGCDGGYGVLVSKFYSEFEAVPESCHPYIAKDGQCSSCNVDKLEHVFSVSDYE